MNRKQLEDCAWKKTPKDERRAQKERYDWKAKKTVTERLKGNNREVLVFDPSGDTPGTLSPWVPLWSLYSDELKQRCEGGEQPKLRAPYHRTRRDYTGDVESSGPTAPTPARVHATRKKSPAQLDREIREALAAPSSSFEEAKAEGALLNKEVDAAGEALNAFPRSAIGLVSEDVRTSPEYRAAKDRFQRAFARLRAFNAVYVKRFAKELRAERSKRYGG